MIGLDSCPWLSTSVITGRLDKNSFDIADLANIVGSGEAVGGMVNATGAGPGHEATQLQRIVARCSCEFYFASFSSDLDPVAEEHAANIEVSGTVSHDCIAGSVYNPLRWRVFFKFSADQLWYSSDCWLRTLYFRQTFLKSSHESFAFGLG